MLFTSDPSSAIAASGAEVGRVETSGVFGTEEDACGGVMCFSGPGFGLDTSTASLGALSGACILPFVGSYVDSAAALKQHFSIACPEARPRELVTASMVV